MQCHLTTQSATNKIYHLTSPSNRFIVTTKEHYAMKIKIVQKW